MRGLARGGWMVALFLFPFAEVGLTVLLTRWLGGAAAFAFYAVPALVGLAVLWRRYPRVRAFWQEFRTLSNEEGRRRLYDQEHFLAYNEAVSFWLAAVLLLVPGVLSHLLALYLIVRPRLWREPDLPPPEPEPAPIRQKKRRRTRGRGGRVR